MDQSAVLAAELADTRAELAAAEAKVKELEARTSKAERLAGENRANQNRMATELQEAESKLAAAQRELAAGKSLCKDLAQKVIDEHNLLASSRREVEALKEKVGRMEKPHQWMLEEAVKHQERKDLAKRLGVDGSGKCGCSMCLALTPPAQDDTSVRKCCECGDQVSVFVDRCPHCNTRNPHTPAQEGR